mgnify:CR=1 FL=1
MVRAVRRGLLAAALAVAQATQDAEAARLAALRDRLEAMILDFAPDTLFFSRTATRLPNTSAFAFPGLGLAGIGRDIQPLGIEECRVGVVERPYGRLAVVLARGEGVLAEHVEPAMDELLARAANSLEAATQAADPLMALDEMTEPLDWALGAVRHLESVATYPELRAAYNAVQPKTSAFYSSIPLNDALWQAIKKYAESAAGKALTGTKKRFLTKTIDSFKRHGAELDAAGKARLKELDVALAEVTTPWISRHRDG